MKMLVYMFVALFSVPGMAALKDVKPIANTFGWVKPDTEITYKKNACGGPVYEGGYANRGTYAEIEKKAYDYYYKGGECTLTQSTLKKAPVTFPSSYNYDDYIALHPGEDHLVKKHSYECVTQDATTYQFDFEIEPTFQCTSKGCYEEVPNCMGDIVARYLDIPGVHGFGHTGLYAGDKVLEIIGEDAEIVQLNPMDEFKRITTYWGSGYNAAKQQEDKDPEIDYDDAVEMIDRGLKQRMFFPEYTLAPIYKEGRFYVKDNHIRYEKGLFRCDTYIQFLYKKVLNTDLPPHSVYQVPFNQWKAFTYKRNPPNNPAKEPTFNQTLTENVMADRTMSDSQKAAKLIAQFPQLKNNEERLRTFDSVSVLYSRESFRFLLEQYYMTDNIRTKLRILAPLRYQYLHYQDQPSFAGLVAEVKKIYDDILDKADKPSMLRRAIEDMTLIYSMEQAERELEAFDVNDLRYRSAYLTSMSIAYINNHHMDGLKGLVKNMNACELTDRMPLYQLSYWNNLIPEAILRDIQTRSESEPHEKDCVHQHMARISEPSR